MNMFLLESSTDSFVAASAVTATGLDAVVVVNASAEEMAMRKSVQICRNGDMVVYVLLLLNNIISFVKSDVGNFVL